MTISQIITALGNYFLNPFGLLAASGIVPLLIFYLVKKKPKEEVMPSMMFFMEQQKSGKVRSAFQTLLRNLMLLLHILIIIGFSVAIAEPFVETPADRKNAVVVLDHSASMENNFNDAKSYLKKNLGQKTTLITVSDEVNVPVKEGSKSQVKKDLNSVKLDHTGTDITSALQTAGNYKGPLFIASDLDQTSTEKDPVSKIEQMRNTGRTVKVIDTEEDNSWGIIDLETAKEETKVDIKNFKPQKEQIEVTVNGNSREETVEAGSVKTVSLDMKKGENRIELESDGFKPDNKAFVSVPGNENYEVMFISDQKNSFLEKAFELIEFTSIETVKPPVQQELDADIYIIGKTDKILSKTIEKIESDVNEGAGMVVFSHTDVFSLGFSSLPVEKAGGKSDTTVNLRNPVRTTFSTKVFDVKKVSGEEYTMGSNGVVKDVHGDGQVVFYNVQDENFQRRFLYPVFWKRITREMMNQPSIDQLNRETGEELEAESIEGPDGEKNSGRIKMDKIGFYKAEGHSYAANLVDRDESYAEPTEKLSESSESIEETENRNIQHFVSIIVLLLLLGELGYLVRLGEMSRGDEE